MEVINLYKNNKFNQKNNLEKFQKKAKYEFGQSNFLKPLSLDQNLEVDEGFTDKVFEEKNIEAKEDI